MSRWARGWCARLLMVPVLLIGMTACGFWSDDSDAAPPLPGERIPIAQDAPDIQVSPDLAGAVIDVGEGTHNTTWSQKGQNAQNNAGHVALSTLPDRIWSRDIGASADGESHYNFASPVVSADTVFVVDADLTVGAFIAKSGDNLWQTELDSDDLDTLLVVGGLALDETALYVSTGVGDVAALNPLNGQVLWRKNMGVALHDAPTILGDRVFVMAIDNTVFALDRATGETAWTYEGLSETTTLLAGGGVVGDGNRVIAAFSNGEILALDAAGGHTLWGDSLTTRRYLRDQLANIADIQARPVIDAGKVFAISHGGRFVAFDLATGDRLWARNMGGVNSPAIAGDMLFVIDNNQTLYAMRKDTGQVYWMRTLPVRVDDDENADPVQWSGPVVAGGQLYVAGSQGHMMAISPQDGATTHVYEVSDHHFTAAPVVADKTLYILNTDADLIALQ